MKKQLITIPNQIDRINEPLNESKKILNPKMVARFFEIAPDGIGRFFFLGWMESISASKISLIM